MRITVGLIDDNPALIRSLNDNLSVFPEVEILFTASGAAELLHKLELLKPDVLLLDINMPEMNGIEAARKVKELYPDIRIIMLTVFDEEEKVFDSILSGASGYLLKDEKPSKIITALEEAMDGGAPMSPVIASKALKLIRAISGSTSEEQSVDPFGLTKREVEILELISQSDNYQVIADKLFISPKTVRKHIENIYEKLHVHTKLQAVQMGIKHKLI